MAATFTEGIYARVKPLVEGEKTPRNLEAALRVLAKWRSQLIQNSVLQACGTEVLSGVFAGMQFLPASAEGCHVAKLLGTYEQPLQPDVEAAIARGYARVINIGCAEGYYAVGLARRMPNARVLAFDIDANARSACADVAAKNGVTDRVEIGPEFKLQDFARFAGENVLVVCDIEGAEKDLLDPVAAPALGAMDLIVEVHDCNIPGLSKALSERFLPTHEVRLITDTGDRRPTRIPEWFTSLGHLDQLLAVWEWRMGPTPWLVLESRSRRR